MTDGAKEIPCQVAEGELWWILDELPAGATRSYSVEIPAKSSPDGQAVTLKQLEDKIDIAIDGKAFTSYVFAPKKAGPYVLRRPYFFPVCGPGQITMTRPFPMVQEDLPENVSRDHPHHTSIYVAHGAVNGVDNWAIGGKAGYIVHKSFEAVTGGGVMGMFRETLDWTDVGKKPVMSETRVARVYRLPDTHRMLDIEITFRAAYGKVLLGERQDLAQQRVARIAAPHAGHEAARHAQRKQLRRALCGWQPGGVEMERREQFRRVTDGTRQLLLPRRRLPNRARLRYHSALDFTLIRQSGVSWRRTVRMNSNPVSR